MTLNVARSLNNRERSEVLEGERKTTVFSEYMRAVASTAKRGGPAAHKVNSERQRRDDVHESACHCRVAEHASSEASRVGPRTFLGCSDRQVVD